MFIYEQQYRVTSRPILCMETHKLDLTLWKTACKLASKANVLLYIVKPHNVKVHNTRGVQVHVSQAIRKKMPLKLNIEG